MFFDAVFDAVPETWRVAEIRAELVEARTDAAEGSIRANCAQTLMHHIKSSLGIATEVDVVEPGQIERSLGKAKRIIDLRPKA